MPVICDVLLPMWLFERNAVSGGINRIYERGLLRCHPTIDGQCEKPRSAGWQQIQIPALFYLQLNQPAGESGLSTTRMPNGSEIHIGAEIRRVLRERGIPLKQFAELLCCERNSLYYLFSQSSIDVRRLMQISEILQYDFFSLYTASPPGFDSDQFIGIVLLPASARENFAIRYPSAKIIELSELSDN